MCPCEEEIQIVDHLIFKCKKVRKKGNELIRQIENTGGYWAAKIDSFTNNYQNFLSYLNV